MGFMPLQNRVDPFGTIFRTPARGTFMGNRGGVLHNDDRQIVRRHVGQRWLTCVLQFKDRHRIVMTPHRYTELFFLDEATSFAAGHRPCAECRRDRFNAYREAWPRKVLLRATEMDAELHPARIDRQGNKVTYQAELGSLPNGCFIAIDNSAWLVWDDAMLLWTPEGYSRKDPRPHHQTVTVLTPRPSVECFRAGYRPEIHPSAATISV
jgi:hypothetical protein